MSFGLSLILCVFGRDLREAQILLASLRFAQTCDGEGAAKNLVGNGIYDVP